MPCTEPNEGSNSQPWDHELSLNPESVAEQSEPPRCPLTEVLLIHTCVHGRDTWFPCGPSQLDLTPSGAALVPVASRRRERPGRRGAGRLPTGTEAHTLTPISLSSVSHVESQLHGDPVYRSTTGLGGNVRRTALRLSWAVSVFKKGRSPKLNISVSKGEISGSSS